MIYDFSKLRGKIIEKFNSYSAFAEYIGWHNSRVSKVLNNNSGLTMDDIVVWANALGILIDEIGAYFFTVKSHKCEI